MISMAPKLAETIALKTAISDSPLGQMAGSLWYNFFSPSASPWLVAGNVAGLMMLGSVIGAFAGVIADPLQSLLGIHRRRLLKFMAQLALIMRAVRSVGFLRRRRVSRGEFGVLE